MNISLVQFASAILASASLGSLVCRLVLDIRRLGLRRTRAPDAEERARTWPR